jgi:hypothetical protein
MLTGPLNNGTPGFFTEKKIPSRAKTWHGFALVFF